MSKMTWRMAGPQAVFVQKVFDFFWDVGAPESEIDRLNNIGGFIKPAIIGMWRLRKVGEGERGEE
jgi:hypothetical protein